MYKQVSQLFVILTLLKLSEALTMLTAVACDGDLLELHCPPDERIVIEDADYGRWDANICRQHDANVRTDCHAAFADKVIKILCNGKQYCHVKTENIAYNDPCPGQVKYAEVHFQCIRKEYLE